MHSQYSRAALQGEKAIARLPASRSSTGRPVSRPMVDLRDSPASNGSDIGERAQSLENRQVVPRVLAEAEARIDHEALACNAGRLGGGDAAAQKRFTSATTSS